MKILTIYPNSVNQRHIDDAVEALRRGEIIVYPTDTFYALGADALNNRAVERLCRLKGINPDKNLLSVVCSGLSQAAEYARIDNRAFRLMKENLPGAFTFILPASSSLPKVFKSRKNCWSPCARQCNRTRPCRKPWQAAPHTSRQKPSQAILTLTVSAYPQACSLFLPHL